MCNMLETVTVHQKRKKRLWNCENIKNKIFGGKIGLQRQSHVIAL
jgi:hypothetical protein